MLSQGVFSLLAQVATQMWVILPTTHDTQLAPPRRWQMVHHVMISFHFRGLNWTMEDLGVTGSVDNANSFPDIPPPPWLQHVRFHTVSGRARPSSRKSGSQVAQPGVQLLDG